MKPFERALEFVRKEEGGWADHASDRGGKTRFGISSRAHPDVDLDTLTWEQAAEIYRRDYWEAIRGDKLPRSIQVALFDHAVHAGAMAAVQALQRALGVADDGIFGPVTWEALLGAKGAWWGSRELLGKLLEDRAGRLGELVRRDPRQLDFVVGWMRRLIRVALDR